MDKRKIANQQVKDKLLQAMLTLLQEKEWSKVSITELAEISGVARASYYRNFASVEELLEYGLAKIAKQYDENSPSPVEDFHDKELMRYKFRFYKEHMSLILAFHRAKAPVTLLDVITNCVVNAKGDMSIRSISKYELYYYSGAFYNMVLFWLEGGALESPEAMADEFLRLANHGAP